MTNINFELNKAIALYLCIGMVNICNVNAQDNAWEQLSNMSQGCVLPGTCVFQDQIYLFGGTANYSTFYATVDKYHPSTNTWTALNNMPEILFTSNIESANGNIYLIGGFSNGTSNNSNLVFEFNPESQQWTEKTPMPIKVALSSSCILNDNIYIFSGYQSSNSSNTTDTLAYVYNTNIDRWENLPPMLIEQRNSTVHIIDNKIYVIGGTIYEHSNDTHGMVEVLDLATNKWTLLEKMPYEVTAAASVVHNKKIIVFGGGNDNDWPLIVPSNVIQEYDPETNLWHILGEMPFKRSYAGFEKVDNYLYFFGGIDDTVSVMENYSLNEVWRCDLNKLATSDTRTRIQNNHVNSPNFDVLYPNTPNPIKNSTTIKYKLHNTGIASINIYNTLGQKVTSLINQKQIAGEHELIWNTKSINNGLYFCSLQTESGEKIIRLIVNK